MTTPPTPLAMPPVAEPHDRAEAHLTAARAFLIFASIGLFFALLLPWFGLPGFRAASGAGAAVVVKPVTANAWQISGPLAFAIAASVLLVLFVVALVARDSDDGEAELALSALWTACIVGSVCVFALALGIAELPANLSGACAGGRPVTVPTAAGLTTQCAGGVGTPIEAGIRFGAGISMGLAVLLVGAAAWITYWRLREQPADD